MATLTKQYTFSALTSARAAEVNTNFDQIVSFINTNMMQKDGSTAFTGYPLLPGSAPTNTLHAASKGYVDTVAPRIGHGAHTAVTDANGIITLAHGLSFTPTHAVGILVGTSWGGQTELRLTAVTSTTLTFRVFNIDAATGVGLPTQSLTIHWFAGA